ncbi:DUF11 domain-containing protein [Spirosoma sp. KCTC 42546]|uniref:DUF11 domain-containing protein n=1 Tax=Spirosoma sp. KCTC 42546 TaxID=2520506 RepID=UPI00143D15AA|nr:DUF11 domain-containing protein [Spirosoma sp. KCTC 42546]
MLKLLPDPFTFLLVFSTFWFRFRLVKCGFPGALALFLLFGQAISAQSTDTQLSLDKLVDKSKAKIGNVMTYTVVLTNTGTTTATNVIVRDSMSTGLNFVTGSATVPTGTTLTQGTPIRLWKVASLAANQSVSLTYQAAADSSGILYNQATIPGDTATVCTTIPVIFCAGDTYQIRLTAAPGRSSYKWFKNDIELTSQTTNILDITAPGTYSLAVDNVTGKCPDFSCCPFIVEEDTLPTFGAIATPAMCLGTVPQANGQITLSNFRSGYTYQYSLGTDFNPAASLSGAAKAIPAGGIIAANLANPVTAQSYTIRVYNASGCYTDVTAVLLPTTCCQVSIVATPGLCTPLTNTYSTTALITLTNPTAGTLTITDGPQSLTFATTAGSSTTFTAILDNLIPNGSNHTVVVSLPGCSTASTTYTAPTSCSAGPNCSISAVATAGLCQTATNSYSSTVVISLTNPTTGTLTVTNGAQTQTLLTNPTTTSLTATFSNLPSDGASHTVVVSLPGCSTTSTTYTAPASCSIAPSGCNLNAVVTAGLCSTATNTYSVSVVVNLSNAQAGNLIVDAFGADSGSQPVSAGTSSVTFVFSGLIPDGLTRIVKVSLPGCGTTSAAFTAPTACTATPAPVCSVSAVATAGVCQTATNTYSSRVVITLVNPTTGTLTVTNGAQTQTLLTSPATTSLTATFANLLSDGASHTVLVSLPGCSTTSTTYTAPASCSVAPVCSISALVTAGLCSTATNTYSALVVVNLSNAQAGTLTVNIPGATSVSQAVSSGSSSLTLTLPGLLSDGVSHTATVSLPGCGTTTATFTAPTSCSVAPICSLSAVATASLCQTATNTYSSNVIISLTNPITGTLTITNGGQSQTLVTNPATTSLTATFANLPSDGASHQVVVSLPGCSTTNATYTAPASCSVVPSGCNLNAVATAGLCQTATNTYSVSVVVNLSNAQAGNLIVDAFGADSGSQPVSAGTSSVTFVFSGLIPDGLTRIVKVSLPGCGTTSAAFTAPTACTATPAPVCSVSAVATAGVCQTVTNTYSSRVVITLVNPTTGTLTVTNGAQTQTLATSPVTTSLTAVFANLISDGASHTVVVSLSGCSTTSTTYTAPASCSVAPVCSINALVTAGLCSTATNTYSALVVVNLTSAQAGTLTVNIPGATSVSQAVSSGSSSLTLTLPGLLSDGDSHTATVSLPGCGTTTATFTAPTSCSVAPICSVSAVATAGLCSTATNTYSTSVVITLANPTTGTLTVTNGAQTQTLATSPATTSLTAVFANLISDGTSHTVLVSLPGCSTTSTTYTAPASCSVAPVCSISAVATAGLCATATNTYSVSVVVNLSNTQAGNLIVDAFGADSGSQPVSAGTSSVTFVFSDLIPDGLTRIVKVSLPGCGTTSAAFTAPTACTATPAPVCSVSAVATAGLCQTATNTYSSKVVITLVNPTTGTLTVTNGAQTQTLLTSPATTSLTATFANLLSDGASHTVLVSLPGCSTTSTTYTAPASCSVAPVCSISAVATAGLCSTATNTYSALVVVNLSNAQAGTLTVNIPGATSVSQAVSSGSSSITLTLPGLLSDGVSHTATVSLPGCGTTTATFTAPVSCSIAPICSVSAVATAGLCSTATNTYSTSVVITLANPTTGTLTVTNGAQTQTLATSPVTTSLTAVFASLISDGTSHTMLVSLPGCSTTSTTYTAPASCSVAPVCSISAVATAGLCATATNTYSVSVVVNLSNPTAGTLGVTSPGVPPSSQTVSSGTNEVTFVLDGLISDGTSHTVTMSLPGCGTTTATFTAPVSCSVAPVCSISAVATPGICASATNTFTTIAVITLTNPTTGTLTVTDGPTSLTFATTSGSSASFTATLANIVSNGASHTLTATLSGCSSTSTTYTAPTSCSIAPVCSISAAVTVGLCATATNTYSATALISLANAQDGVVILSIPGVAPISQTITASTTSLTAIFTELLSDGASHAVTVSLPGCSTTTALFTAPLSCTSEIGLSITDPGVCQPGTNTYTTTGVISLTNALAGTALISDGTNTVSLSVSAGATSVPYSMSGLISGTGTHTVTVSYLGQISSTTYTAPESCTTAPICSINAVATAGLCQTATNTYSSNVVISLTNPTTGTLTVTNGGQTQTLPTSPTTTSLTATFANLPSDGASHTVLVSLPGCSTTSTTYTAPASCSVAPVCSISAVATAGLCATATNTYSALVVVNLANAQAGTLTVNIPGATSVSQAVSSGSSSLTLTLPGLLSDGVSHTATVSLPGCGTTTATFTAPTSCSVAPICSVSAVATAGLCSTATNTYSTSVVISLTNPTTGTLTVTNGAQTQTLATSPVTTSLTAVFANLISDGTSHTVLVSLPGCSTTSTTYTAPASCSVAPVCSISAVATAGLCATATNTYSASVVVNLTSAISGTLTASLPGVTSISQAVSSGSNSVTLVLEGLLSDGASNSVLVSLPGCSTTTATFSAPASCSITPASCSLSAVTTVGLCQTATNTYTSTALVQLTNPPAGTLTITDGTQSNTFVTTAGVSATFTVSFIDLVSDGAVHTITASLPGCSTATTTYTAPASCSVAPICSISALPLPGLCQSITNSYSSTVIITLTNPVTGTLTVTDGTQTQTLLTSPATINLTAVFTNLVSDGISHTVVVSLPGCTTTSSTYTAPASCQSELGLALTDPGVCQPGTNTYNTTGVISLTNAVAGLATLVDGTSSLTVVVSNGDTSIPYSMSGLMSGTGTHTVTVSYLGQTASTTYTAPTSCSVEPVCSVSAVATAGICSTAANTYSASVVVNLTNAISGTLTVSAPGTAPSSQTVSSGISSLTIILADLISDGNSHTATVSLPGCGTTTATFTAPASCSVAPVCSLSAVASAGLCQTATNSYSSTVVITLTNPTAGTVTVSDGGQSQTLLTSPATTSLTAIFANLLSDGVTHMVEVTLPGCSTISASYSAPVSCTSEISLSITDPGVCQPGTNTYNTTGVISLTNAVAGLALISDGANTITLSVSAGATSIPYSMSGLMSGTGNHTVTVSYLGQIASTTYTAPTSCPLEPVCSVSAVATAVPVTCLGNSPQANGKIVVSGFTTGDTYQYSDGSIFNPAVVLSGAPQVIPADGVIVSNLFNPVAAQTYTVRIFSTCYKDVTVTLLPTVCNCPETSCVPLVIKQTKGARRAGNP